MPFEDQVVTRFTADGRQLLSTLNAIRNNINSTFGAINRQMQNSSTSTARASRSLRSMDAASQTTANHMLRLGEAFKTVEQVTGQMSNSFRRSSMSIQTGIASLDLLALRLDRASMLMWKFTIAAIPLRTLAFQTGAVAAAFGLFTKSVAMSGAELEKARRQFEVMTGSQEKATRIVEYLRAQAPLIRYTISEVVEAGRILTVAGYDVEKLLYPMADLASGVGQAGVTIEHAARAFVDAMHGEFRRLRNTFDITKDEVEAFAHGAINAQGQVVDKTKLQFGILMAIQQKYGDANKAAMSSLIGLLSNLSDSILRVAQSIGEKMIPMVSPLINWVSAFFDRLGKIAEHPFWGKIIAGGALLVTFAAIFSTVAAVIAMTIIQLMGLVAGWRVWQHMSTEGAGQILEAQRQIMAVMEKMGEVEANMAMQSLPLLRARLEVAREELRIKELSLELSRATTEAEMTRIRTEIAAADERRRLVLTDIQLMEDRLNLSTLEAEASAMRPPIEAALQRRTMITRRRRGLQEEITSTEGILAGPLTENERVNAQIRLNNLQNQLNTTLTEEARIRENLQYMLRQRHDLQLRINRATAEGTARTTEQQYATAPPPPPRPPVRPGRTAFDVTIGAFMSGFTRSLMIGQRAVLGFAGSLRTLGNALIVVTRGFFTMLGSLLGVALQMLILIGIIEGLKWVFNIRQRALDKLAKSAEDAADSLQKLATQGGVAVEEWVLKAVEGAKEQAKFYTDMSKKISLFARVRGAVPLGYLMEKAGVPEGEKAVRARQFLQEWQETLPPEERARMKPIEEMTDEEVLKYSISARQAMKFATDKARELTEVLQQQNKIYSEQGAQLDANARAYVKTLEENLKTNQNVTGEQSEQIENQKKLIELVKSLPEGVSAAPIVIEYLNKQIDLQKSSIETSQEQNKLFEDGIKSGKKFEDIYNELYTDLQRDKATLNAITENQKTLNTVTQLGAEERQKANEELREEIRLRTLALNLARTEYDLTRFKGGKEAYTALGGEELPTLAKTEAQLEYQRGQLAWQAGDYEKAWEHYAAYSKILHSQMQNDLDKERELIGANTDELEKSLAEYRSYGDEIALVNTLYAEQRRVIEAMWLADEQRSKALIDLETQRRQKVFLLEQKRQEALKKAATESNNRIISGYEAQKERLDALGGTTAQLMLYDLRILKVQMDNAKLQGSTAEIIKLQAEYTKKIHDYQIQIVSDVVERLSLEQQYDDALGSNFYTQMKSLGLLAQQHSALAKMLFSIGRINDAIREQTSAQQLLNEQVKLTNDLHDTRINLLEKLAERGLASEASVERARMLAARDAYIQAQRYGLQTKAGLEAMSRYLDLTAEETKDNFDDIIGSIIGAPQEFMNQILSLATISQQFGDVGRFIAGPQNRISAEFLNRNKSEMTIRVKIEGIPDGVEEHIRSAVDNSIRVFGNALKDSLSG